MVATASTKQQEIPIHLSSRRKQVTILRLRTGHNRMSYHLFNKLRIAESALCPCRSASQTTEHLLQVCTLHADLCSKNWKDATPLATKLYNTKKDLRRTVTFAMESGVAAGSEGDTFVTPSWIHDIGSSADICNRLLS